MLTQRDTRFPSNKRCVSVHLNDLMATHNNNAQRYDLVLRGWAHPQAAHTACEFGGILHDQCLVIRHVRGNVVAPTFTELIGQLAFVWRWQF